MITWGDLPSRPGCIHCYCQRTLVGQAKHKVCCMCANRVALRNGFGWVGRG